MKNIKIQMKQDVYHNSGKLDKGSTYIVQALHVAKEFIRIKVDGRIKCLFPFDAKWIAR